jgi:hypothetical protein
MSSVPTKSAQLKIAIGQEQAGIFMPGLPLVAGLPVEELFPNARPAGTSGTLTLFRADDWLLGAATLAITDGLESASLQLYRDILQATQGLQLARIWNYVPAINEFGPGKLENYVLFCRGRSLAFEQHHGGGFTALLPAASAVGTSSSNLTVAFAANSRSPRHLENPLQVPAYEYPAEYGPRSPSFARATIIAGVSSASVFISGTAAIRGHATIAPYRLPDQLACTLENLQEISSACGLSPNLDRNGGSVRHFKVYLRDAADQPLVAGALAEKILTPTDRISYLQADICRASLLVEIEASLFNVKSFGT